LTAIASLPHLAVFSDEAHHTYGQSLDTELKKVRKTVDYLKTNSPNLICVVNTTGTPYFQRQPLRDVVIWYGLAQGIRDGILKDVANNIRVLDLEGDVEVYLARVIETFFADYGEVMLPDGTPAKLAIYFPQTADVEQARPILEAQLAALGLPNTLILEHHTGHESKADFDRFKFKDSPHRIALLVDRGVEGWDVPALFACALARKLKTSNNFVLQAASRCLRQIPGNTTPARIYLTRDNYGILDRQLQETYGETIGALENAQSRSRSTRITLRQIAIPPLVVKRLVYQVVRQAGPMAIEDVRLSLPTLTGPQLTETTFELAEQVATQQVLKQVGDAIEIKTTLKTTDVYMAAHELATIYRLDSWPLLAELKRLYPAGEVPLVHLGPLAEQVEQVYCRYSVETTEVEDALALIKLDGFDREEVDGNVVYTAEITYPVEKEALLKSVKDFANAGDFGFHYTPYNFDSQPEVSFFELLLAHINLHPSQVENIYFTGALTSASKTDFFIEYRVVFKLDG